MTALFIGSLFAPCPYVDSWSLVLCAQQNKVDNISESIELSTGISLLAELAQYTNRSQQMPIRFGFVSSQ
jgi:hypothetical protein